MAIALSQQADLALLAWEPVNDRMAYVRLKGHFTNTSVVSVYAPTSAAEQRDKEAFYSQLQALVERLPRRDLLIVAGDWNGRTGPGDPITSHLLGRFGLGSRCENGERLLNFDDRNRLLVTNTCLQHRKKHLLTCLVSTLWLHEVIERAWRDEVVPDDWDLGTPAPILKKGDKTRCENYRGIGLTDVAAKIFAIVLLRRFQAVRDARTRSNQAGFRAGRGCVDQIFTLRRILEFRHSYQQPTAVCFIVFAAAFDSVHREPPWRIMALDGVPAKIIAMIKAYYRSTTARVLVRNNLAQPFGIRSGVRRGFILSPILFDYAIDWIPGRAQCEGDGVEFAPGHRLVDLDYADDIALLASTFGDLQSMVSRVNEVANRGCQLEDLDSFKYLGARLLPNGQIKDEIVSRIDAARWVFSSLRKCLWIRRDLSIAAKIRVYYASVQSVLLYGCECWALCVEDERKLEVFDHHCLTTILRVKFTDFVSNETVRARCDNIARITQTIQERRLRWFENLLRRRPKELSVTALDPAPLPHWRRRRGGQCKTWLDTVRQDMEVILGPSVFGLRRWRRKWVELSRSAAADRHAWRGTVRDIIDAG
ncbi:hypothetical protein SprV_0301097200 [Sparganum proliferum]